MLLVNYGLKANKQMYRKIDQICGYQRWGSGGKQNWMKTGHMTCSKINKD